MYERKVGGGVRESDLRGAVLMMAFNRRQLRGQGERDVGNGGSSHSAHQDTSLAE
jgi:hypothetical protein